MSAPFKNSLIESSLTKFRLDGGTNLKLLSGGEKRKLSLASEVHLSLSLNLNRKLLLIFTAAVDKA